MSLGADTCEGEDPGPALPAGATRSCAPGGGRVPRGGLSSAAAGVGQRWHGGAGEAGSGWGTVNALGLSGRLVVAPVNIKCALLYPCRVARHLATSPPRQKGGECLGCGDRGGTGS